MSKSHLHKEKKWLKKIIREDFSAKECSLGNEATSTKFQWKGSSQGWISVEQKNDPIDKS